MLEQIFVSLSNALTANSLIGIGAAFVWGILSILLSPCHLASIPLIVGFMNGRPEITTARAFKLSASFTFGLLAMMALIGLVTGLMGRLMGDLGGWMQPLMGVVFILVALVMADIIKLPAKVGPVSRRKSGYGAAMGLGFMMGIALGPCSFAFMAPILGLVLGSAGSRLAFSLGLLFAYIIGHCMVLVLAGTFAGRVQVYLNWTAKSRGTRIVRYVCAALVAAAGIYLIAKKG